MDIETVKTFFMWCTVINGAMLSFWIIMFILVPEVVYRTQSKWFSISREYFDTIMYAFFGLYKIFFLIFNLVPYVALEIVA